jgi:predicted DNA binding protein
MQYAVMIDLLEKAKEAGKKNYGYFTEVIAHAFESWIGMQNVADLTEEEEDTLRDAFEKGFKERIIS